jgi:hypothetical protein
VTAVSNLATQTIVVIDLETTGGSPGSGAHVIEFGAALVAGGRVTQTVGTLVRPPRYGDLQTSAAYFARQVHRIDDDTVWSRGMPPGAAATRVTTWLERVRERHGPVVLTSYNLPFERRFLDSQPWRLDTVEGVSYATCVLATARAALPQRRATAQKPTPISQPGSCSPSTTADSRHSRYNWAVSALSCPSCGAPLPTANPGVVMAICEYCSNAVVYDEDAVNDIGKQAVLSEGFTRLYRGATGTIADNRFTVLGRVRYSFGQGFWDEWYLELEDASHAWVTEDDHDLALETRFEGTAPPMDDLTPGDRIELGGVTYQVDEIGEARCVGLEGQLPKAIESDEVYRYADLSSMDGTLTMAVEYDDTPPSVFVGRWLEPDEIQLDDPGVEW